MIPPDMQTYHNQSRTAGVDGPHTIVLRSVRDDCKWIFRNWSSSNTFAAELGTRLGKFEGVLQTSWSARTCRKSTAFAGRTVMVASTAPATAPESSETPGDMTFFWDLVAAFASVFGTDAVADAMVCN